MAEYGNWIIDFQEDYSQFWEKCNWYNFRFCHIEFENDKIMGGWEFFFVIMGLGFIARWNHTETEDKKRIKKQVDDLLKEHGLE